MKRITWSLLIMVFAAWASISLSQKTPFPASMVAAHGFRAACEQRWANEDWVLSEVSWFTAVKINPDWWKIFAAALNVKDGYDTCSYFLYNPKSHEIKGEFIGENLLKE